MNVSVNRLNELQTKNDYDELDVKEPIDIKEPLPSIEFEKFNSIKLHVDVLNSVCTLIGELTDTLQKTVMEEKRHQIISRVNTIVDEMNQKNMNMKRDLDRIKLEVDQESRPIIRKILTNMYNMYVTKVRETLDTFHHTMSRFQHQLTEQSRRELMTVCPNLSEEKMTEMIDNGVAREVIQKSIGGEQIEQIIFNIEHNHMEIVKLEKKVAEIYQLFCDLALLVDLQQESLNIIEVRVQKATDYTKNGHEELKVADKYSKSARKRLCIILCCVMIIIVVILVPVLKTKLSLF